MMMTERTFLVTAALVTASLLPATPAAGQAVGVSYIAATTDHVELPDPSGPSIHARLPLGSGWHVKLAYYTISNDTEKEGVVCVNYSQRIGCEPEQTLTSTTLSGFRASLLHSFRLTDLFRIEGAGGASFNHVDAESTGVSSGDRADLLVPNGGQIGILGSISVGITPFPRVPVTLIGGFKAHWVNFTGCSGEEVPQYDPFCDAATVRELQAGIEYAF